MAPDPITIDVIANALKSLIYEMDAAIERTAMSIIIREQHDFGMSLVDHRGWVVAGTPFAGQTLAAYATAHPVEPGDVIMFNDPYLSQGEISHLGDTMLAVPIFWDGHLIAWGIAWGHHVTTPPVETGGFCVVAESRTSNRGFSCYAYGTPLR